MVSLCSSRGIRFFVLFTLPHIFPDYGDACGENNKKNNRREVFLYAGDFFPQIKSDERDAGTPYNGAHDVVGQERAVSHLHDACDYGCEGADYRQEARKDDGQDPVVFVEIPRTGEMFLPEKAGILSLEQLYADFCTEPVPRTIAENGGEGEKWNKDPYVEKALGGEESCREEHGSSRKEKSEKHS